MEIEIEVVHTRVGTLYVASQVGGRVLTRDFGGQPCRGHLGPPPKNPPPPLFNVEVGCLDEPSEKKASTLKRGGEEGVA